MLDQHSWVLVSALARSAPKMPRVWQSILLFLKYQLPVLAASSSRLLVATTSACSKSKKLRASLPSLSTLMHVLSSVHFETTRLRRTNSRLRLSQPGSPRAILHSSALVTHSLTALRSRLPFATTRTSHRHHAISLQNLRKSARHAAASSMPSFPALVARKLRNQSSKLLRYRQLPSPHRFAQSRKLSRSQRLRASDHGGEMLPLKRQHQELPTKTKMMNGAPSLHSFAAPKADKMSNKKER